MAIAPNSPAPSLRAVMRPVPQVAPEDSLERYLQTIRFLPVATLPVVHRGRLQGIVRVQDVMQSLATTASPSEREARLHSPIAPLVRAAPMILSPETSPQEAERRCADFGELLLPVVDAEGYYLGVVLATDLLVPDLPRPVPPRIGGMATPFGVYLTDGIHQAGAGNLALVATGSAIALLMTLTLALVEGGLRVGRALGWLPAYSHPRFDIGASDFGSLNPLATLGLTGIALIIFLSLLRATRLAGYHAAEHQTVHALERGERLVPEIVSRMPRPHPRCGTNLMAAGILFSLFWQIFAYVPMLREIPALFAAIGAACFWRPFGTLLQEWFTTRPATPRELASGIAAGEELVWKYLHSPPARPRLWRRLWNMGLVQTLAGMLLTFWALELIPFVRSFLS